MKKITQNLSVAGNSYINYLCSLKYNDSAICQRLSKIICTIGPASRSPEILEKLIAQGMNIARMNFSHGTHEYHSQTVRFVREAIKNYSSKMSYVYPLAIALDTKGPEIRTGLIDGSVTGEIELKAGETINLTPNDNYKEKSTKEFMYVDYQNILNCIQPGNRIFLDDGLISLIAEKIENDAIFCKIECGGKLGSSKGVNLPGIDVDLPAISEKDISDLQFGVREQVDMIFASFIRNADSIHEIRNILGSEGSDIKIISKIENHQGMKNINEIIDASDGIMVARGDLGIEIPAEKVFIAQKIIIARCNSKGKPVICATQMLESMTQKPRPTRAEVSDVANAILDGADCVMLSGETAKGKYPLECVKVMSDICREAENVIWYQQYFNDLLNTTNYECSSDHDHVMAIAVVQTSMKMLATAIIVITSTGRSAFLLSKYRPRCPIIMVTDCKSNANIAQLKRGICAVIYNKPISSCMDQEFVSRKEFALEYALKQGFIKTGDAVVIFAPSTTESSFQSKITIENVS